jgi:hypothetical protein
MTHAVFCLWVLDNYDKVTARLIIINRESLMVDIRHLIRFKEFNKSLITLKEKNKGKTVSEQYMAILEWCKIQIP